MLKHIMELDREVALAVNGWNSPIADSIMLFFSNIPSWIPLYILMAALMFVPRWYGAKSPARKVLGLSGNPSMGDCHLSSSGKALDTRKFWVVGLISLAAVGICFGFTDQTTHIMKETIQRFRPSHEPSLESLLRLPEGVGGLYGFPSGHAASSMGFAVITALIFRRWWYSVGIISWSLVIAYSRMYLAKHYLSDVMVGALIGIMFAVAIYYLWKYVLLHRRHDRPLL